MAGPERSSGKFEGLSTEQISHLKELRDLVGGEEGALAAEHELLGMQLTHELNILEMPDAEDLVAGHLMASKDSRARTVLVEHLSNEPRARKAIRLLRDMERFLSKNA